MLVHIVIVSALLFLSYGDTSENESIRCNTVDAPLDFDGVVGTWQMVAFIVPKERPANYTNLYNCIDSSEFVGMVREKSRDFIMTVGNETFNFKDVEEMYGFKKTNGCYQRVKSLDDRIIDSQTARFTDQMMVQFYLVPSSELLLVQDIWHTVLPNRVALVYSKNTDHDISEKTLQPVMKLVKNLRGKPQSVKYCINERNMNEMSPENFDIRRNEN